MTMEAGPSNRANPKEERNEQSKMRNELPQGNYPSTPILNSMIIDLVPAEMSIG
ncbi:38692_t:CDS:2, partial [Gigaspora margarita]